MVSFSVWDWKESAVEVNLEDARNLASESWPLDNVFGPISLLPLMSTLIRSLEVPLQLFIYIFFHL